MVTYVSLKKAIKVIQLYKYRETFKAFSPTYNHVSEEIQKAIEIMLLDTRELEEVK